jgi:hypothetical protein
MRIDVIAVDGVYIEAAVLEEHARQHAVPAAENDDPFKFSAKGFKQRLPAPYL